MWRLIAADGLAVGNIDDLGDETPYDGLVRPTVGPYPMKQNVTYPWFVGTTFSSVASADIGAMLHEMGHALGLPHDFRNDDNSHGNLMGNGLRGFRGWFDPARFVTDDLYLSYGDALALANSPYFAGTASSTTTPRPPSTA